jgi:hypothetical protein
LQLRVDFPAVADKRDVGAIQRIVDRIVIMERLFLIRRQRTFLRINFGFGVARASLKNRPFIGMMKSQMPGAGAASSGCARIKSPAF